ncbi:hypothetical protein AaE_011669 [Aphanomyces astaci]|uniref:Uncharacterized protein n=1 Tax=Aphanomyces astaci TaxID=112090 RepID=A0A6A4ZP22_APHAT|nr:hypothetical protein AaE_011669 [Aphanomyces astaci]
MQANTRAIVWSTITEDFVAANEKNVQLDDQATNFPLEVTEAEEIDVAPITSIPRPQRPIVPVGVPTIALEEAPSVTTQINRSQEFKVEDPT